MMPMRDPFDVLVCDAGRRAHLRGRWQRPCDHVFTEGDAVHTLGWPGVDEPLHFCSAHMAVLIAEGLVEQPAIPRDEWERLTGLDDA